MSKKYNKIILLAIDTLRADHLGCYGYELQTSPFIDQLSENGVLLRNHYASDVPTPPSFTSIFFGERGINNGIIGFNDTYFDFKPSAPSLTESFAEQDFRTGMISNLLYRVPWLVNGFNDIFPPGLRFQGGMAEEVTEESYRWLQNHGQEDFFLFLHYWDPHKPYTRAPDNYKNKFSPDQYTNIKPSMEYFEEDSLQWEMYKDTRSHGSTAPEDGLRLYDSEIRYTDDQIKKLFSYLGDLGLEDDTLVVLVGDHGQRFGEYGFWDHFSCYKNISHTPLIIWNNGDDKGEIEDYVQSIDIMPTLLDFAGTSVPEEIDGESLVPLLKGEGSGRDYIVTNTDAIPVQRMYLDHDYGIVHTISCPVFKYIDNFEFFDNKSDPSQLNDISQKKEKQFIEYKIKLSNWVDKQIKDSPDPLQMRARRGGSLLKTFEKTFKQNPSLVAEDEELLRVLTVQYGLAMSLFSGQKLPFWKKEPRAFNL